MNATFDFYDAFRRVGANEDDARLLSEAISTRESGEQIGRLDERLDRIETHLGKVDERLDKVEIHLGKVDERLDKVETQLMKVEVKLDTGFRFIRWTLGLLSAAQLATLALVVEVLFR